MRSVLDRLYSVSLWLGAICLVLIAVLVALQVLARLLDIILKSVGLSATDFVILSLAEIAGYLLAAASTLALAGTLKAGAHIRVTMALGSLSENARQGGEAFIHAFGALASAYLTYSMGVQAIGSFQFNEVSTGLVPVQLGWPQAAMSIGFVILTIAFLDELHEVITRGRPSYRATEDAITLGKEG